MSTSAKSQERAAALSLSPPPRRFRPPNQRTLTAIGSFLAFFVLWEVAARLGWINAFFFSSPSGVLGAAGREVQQARFWNDVRVSGMELFVGYGVAAILGIPIGLILGWYVRLGDFFGPWLNFFYATPRIAYLPLIILWAGISVQSKMIVVFLGAFFVVVLNTLHGVRTVDPRLLGIAHSFGASRLHAFKTVILPGTVPFILAGLRLAVGLAMVGVVVGELYAANAGLGHMIALASHALEADRVLFGVLVFTLMGVVAIELLRLVEVRVEQWRPPNER